MSTIDELVKIRKEKIEKLKDKGINPYPSSWNLFKKRVSIEKCRQLKLGEKLVAAGRIMSWRGHGKIIFSNLRDGSGEIQICFKNDKISKKSLDIIELLDIGDFIGIEGELFKTKKGEVTVLVLNFVLLAKSLRPLPSEHFGLEDKEIRYRERYVDLIVNPKVRQAFVARTKILTLLRQYLDEKGFLEVETPILQPLYGGASARPFTTHLNALDVDLYLRISDELYLKRLIVGGFDRVYEVSKDFRNEGIDRQHNPEFTQIEFYCAYADYNDLMRLTEEMISSVVKEVCGKLKIQFEGKKLDFTPPWPRLNYRDLIKKEVGIDIDQIDTEEKLKKAIAGKKPNFNTSEIVGYGAILDDLYKEFARPKIIQPTFLIDHPAQLMPLAKRKSDNPSRIESMQLLVSGYEVVKAYSELNDPQDQKERWEEQEGLAKKGLEEHEVLDQDYIRALEYGMPPTAGWGIGIDRLSAILTDQHSIRDVIFFPFMRPKKK